MEWWHLRLMVTICQFLRLTAKFSRCITAQTVNPIYTFILAHHSIFFFHISHLNKNTRSCSSNSSYFYTVQKSHPSCCDVRWGELFCMLTYFFYDLFTCCKLMTKTKFIQNILWYFNQYIRHRCFIITNPRRASQFVSLHSRLWTIFISCYSFQKETF